MTQYVKDAEFYQVQCYCGTIKNTTIVVLLNHETSKSKRTYYEKVYIT